MTDRSFMSAALVAEMSRLAYAIADREVVADIETNGLPTQLEASDQQWFDIGGMLDQREHSPQALDMTAQALAFAQMRGLIAHHPQRPTLVRLLLQR